MTTTTTTTIVFKQNPKHATSCIQWYGYINDKKVCYLLFDELWELIDIESGQGLGTRETLNGQYGVARLALKHYNADEIESA